MRKQVRYHTEQSIIKRIDKYHDKHQSTMVEIAALDQQIAALKVQDALPHKISAKMDVIERLEKRDERIIRRLNRLKEKLAEFRTPLLSFVNDGDQSVAA
jgi:hypothetical protein